MTTSGSGTGISAVHSTVIVGGLLAVGSTVSSTTINCVTVMALPQASVTLSTLSMVSGQDEPLDVSETKATVGTEQLSASSVTTAGSGAGISAVHSTVIVGGLLAVGSMVSSTTIS